MRTWQKRFDEYGRVRVPDKQQIKRKTKELYDAMDRLHVILHDEPLEEKWPLVIRRRRIAVGLTGPADVPSANRRHVLVGLHDAFNDVRVDADCFDVEELDVAARRAANHLHASTDNRVVAYGSSWYFLVLVAVRMELDRKPLRTAATANDGCLVTSDILDRVLRVMGEHDRRRVRAVSRSWYNATCDPLLRPSGIVGHIAAAIDVLGGIRMYSLKYRVRREIFLLAAVVQRWLAS
jgi:hypothetical protein